MVCGAVSELRQFHLQSHPAQRLPVPFFRNFVCCDAAIAHLSLLPPENCCRCLCRLCYRNTASTRHSLPFWLFIITKLSLNQADGAHCNQHIITAMRQTIHRPDTACPILLRYLLLLEYELFPYIVIRAFRKTAAPSSSSLAIIITFHVIHLYTSFREQFPAPIT